MAIALPILLSLPIAMPVSAAGTCVYPTGYPAANVWKVAENGDFKSQNGRLYICINGNWQDYGPDDSLPTPVNGRILAEPDSTLVGTGERWDVLHEQKYAAANLTSDPNRRTTADTAGGFYTIEYTHINEVTGETSTQWEPAIRLSGRNLTPGATYYAFATKTMWDQTPSDGWNVQTGEAMQMQNSDGSYTSAVATSDGTATFVVKNPPSWHGWEYGRLVMSGGGSGCSAPIQL